MQIDIYKITDKHENLDHNNGLFIKLKPIKGASLSAREYFSRINKYYSKTGNLLTPSELGCTLSHLEVYKKIIERNVGAIIFEADIKLNEKLIAEAIEVICRVKKNFVHLGWHPDVCKSIFFWGQATDVKCLYLLDYRIPFYGSYSYYVSVKAAQEILNYHEECIMQADPWADFFTNASFKPYFYGIFSHPVERGILASERNLVKLKMSQIIANKIRVKIIKNIRKLVNKKIKPRKSTQRNVN